MHFFNPAPVLPLVEVVSGLATAPAVAAVVHATAAAWGKVPVHASSTPGFIVNRCARPFYAEALRLLSECAAEPATIDAIMRETGGFRMGPFELMDLIGLDVNFAVTRSVWEACFHDPRFTPSVVQRELVAAGFLGRKTGRGFYRYGDAAVPPVAATESPQPVTAKVRCVGDDGSTAGLRARFAAAALDAGTPAPRTDLAPACFEIGDALLVPSDGRTATALAAAAGLRNVLVFDLAFDYGTCKRIAIAAADTCDEQARRAVVGALQAAGMAVSIGLDRVQTVLRHLAAHYGEERYRISPLLARRCASGGSFTS
jgi:3-hydroxybutyryl-CoA dehydrogenase